MQGDFLRFKGQSLITTEVFVRDVDGQNESEARSIAQGLASLLGFLCSSQVELCLVDLNGIQEKRAVQGVAMFFRPVGDIRDGGWVKASVESMWPAYSSMRKQRQLDAVFDYLSTSDLPQQPIEVRLLLTFVVLENLKATYAYQEGIPFFEGHFRQVSVPPKASLKQEKTIGFSAMLTAMFARAGMAPVLNDLVDLRNEVVHFGLSQHPASTLVKQLDAARSLVHEYLLRLLNFRGVYFDYAVSKEVELL